MNETTVTNLKLYEELTIEKRTLESRIEALKEVIVPELELGQKIETGLGIFTLDSRKKWLFSDKVKDLEKQLKAAQAREQADGSAEAVDGDPYLVYREKK